MTHGIEKVRTLTGTFQNNTDKRSTFFALPFNRWTDPGMATMYPFDLDFGSRRP